MSAGEHERGGDFWRAQARRYDRAINVLNRRFDVMAGDVAAALAGQGRVLEVAAGTGLVTARVAPVVEHLVATDRSPDMLEILRGRVTEARLTNVSVEVADVLALPFEAGSFDALVMANVLHLLPEPARALEQARRVLREGGLLCVPTFCHGENVLAHLVSLALGVVRFPVVTRYSGESLATAVDAAGFRMVERRRFSGVLPLWLIVARSA